MEFHVARLATLRVRRLANVLAAAALAASAAGSVAADRAADAPPLGPFRALEVSGLAEVTLIQGDTERVSVEAPPDTQARIRIDNVGGRLIISAVGGSRLPVLLPDRGTSPRLTVRFRTLEAIDLSGAIKMDSRSIDVPRLAIVASGATELRIDALVTSALKVTGSGAFAADLAGRAAEQTVTISGAGEYRAMALASEQASVDARGASRVEVRAERKLDARVSGASTLDYVGSPEITQQVTGAARLRRRE